MSDQQGIGDFAAEYLKRLDQRFDSVDQKLDRIDQKIDRIDIRLKIVEAHMTGFMSSARYLETEIDSLRGRVEAIESFIHRGQGPS